MRIVSWLRPVATGDRGFTMVTVILAMMVVSMLGAGAYAATVGDMPVARKDQDRKRAYEAAQAGVDWYLNQLRADPDWWRGCTHGAATTANPLTQAPVDGVASTSNVWQKVDDVAGTDLGDSQFRVELIRQNGQPCDLSNPGTAKDASGTLWIRSTGASGGKVRSVLAGLKEQSAFLKYLYFSNWESMDPQFNNASADWAPADGTGGNRNQCDYVRKVRDTESASYNWLGQIICVGNVFYNGDVLKGSVHTNDDSFQNCGATLGRNSDDVVEVANAPADPGAWLARQDGPRNGNPTGYNGQETNSLRCPSGSPSVATSLDSDHIKATVKAPGDNLQLPPSNIALKKESPLLLKGQSCIEFIASGVRVTKRGDHPDWGKNGQIDCSGAFTDYSLPASGVIYVEGEGACTARIGHNASTNYTSSPGCGDVAVKGTYPASVTVGAENDIIITGNLERGTDGALLGLVANSYVRIYQPLTGNPYQLYNQEGTSYLETIGWMDKRWPCKQAEARDDGLIYQGTGRMGKVPGYDAPHKIQAAVMSVNNTFVVDNGFCEPLGDLEFEGAIASYWGTNLSFSLDLAAADCKTARRVHRRLDGGPWDYNTTEHWSWPHLGPLYWHPHSNSPWGEYVFVLNGTYNAPQPNQYGVILGTWAPEGTTVCGSVIDTGVRWKSGYGSRDWTYDNRLKYDAPPHFIMPLNSDGRWVAGRRTEQVPTPVVPPTS